MTATLVHPRADLAVFAVTGNDRLSWLNGLVTCELAKLKPGSGAFGLAVGKTGKISADIWFVAASDRVLVILGRDRLEAVRDHFDKHLVMEDAEMSAPLDRGVIFTHGPASAELVAAARSQGAEAAMIDWTGRRDAAVIVATEGAGDATRDALVAKGGALIDDEAWEATRVAWGVPRRGADYDEQSLPQEASLEKVAVSFEKGCYLGQETVFMLEKRGHAKKRLVRLDISGEGDLAPGAPVLLADGSAVGELTSVARTPEGGTVALGHVKYKLAVAGQEVTAGGRAARVIGLAAQPA